MFWEAQKSMILEFFILFLWTKYGSFENSSCQLCTLITDKSHKLILANIMQDIGTMYKVPQREKIAALSLQHLDKIKQLDVCN